VVVFWPQYLQEPDNNKGSFKLINCYENGVPKIPFLVSLIDQNL
jgi:hypothetical protein